jgi:hypothetical protein
MHAKLAAALVVAAVGGLALAPAASAHNIRVSPRFAEVGTDFVFFGTAWQPFKRVYVRYDESADGSVEQRGSFFANAFGSFRFRWRGENVADTHKMCFRQYDSRRRFRRTFTRCQLFTALPG